MLSLLPESPAHFDAIDRVHTLAFGTPAEARLVRALRSHTAYIADLSIVAVQRDQVVGHVLLTRVTIQDSNRHTPGLALAPIAVLPDLQRAGIGSALIRRAFAEARRLGHRLIIVLGHPTYYPRFGFEPAHPRGIEAPFPVRSEAWMVHALVPGALDGVRGTVQYAAPFNAL